MHTPKSKGIFSAFGPDQVGVRRHAAPLPHPAPSVFRSAAPDVESLEVRRLFAVTASIVGSALVVQGDSSANEIIVSRESDGDLIVGHSLDYDAFGTFSSTGLTKVKVSAGAGNDTVRFGNDRNYHGGAAALAIPAEVYGENDNDVLEGTNNNDTMYGGYGTDNIDGYLGNDRIDGGDDNDTIDGHDGNDTVFGWYGADSVQGVSGNDSLDGGGGNDVITSGGGTDTLIGGDGDDYLDARDGGIDGNDVLNGDDGTDTGRYDGTDTANSIEVSV